MSKGWSDLADVERSVDSAANNLLLIDGNNLSYRYIQRANFDSYQDDYIRTVLSLGRSYSARNTVVCFDFGKSYYRTEHLPEYKGTRKKPETEEEQEHYDKFFSVLNSLPEILPCNSVKFRGVEADDLIAYVCSIKEHLDYDHIWIVSSDKDLLQLLDHDVSIFNIFSRKEITIDTLYEDTGLSPEEYLVSRIIEGDKSDNILGIEGIGPKRAQGLVKKYKTFETLITKIPSIKPGSTKYLQNLIKGKDTLIRNEQLISLKKYNKRALEAGQYGYEDIISDMERML